MCSMLGASEKKLIPPTSREGPGICGGGGGGGAFDFVTASNSCMYRHIHMDECIFIYVQTHFSAYVYISMLYMYTRVVHVYVYRHNIHMT